jgi:hypothetical protein
MDKLDYTNISASWRPELARWKRIKAPGRIEIIDFKDCQIIVF